MMLYCGFRLEKALSSQSEVTRSGSKADDGGPLTPIFASFQSVDSGIVLREAVRFPEHKMFGDVQQRSPRSRRALEEEGSGFDDSTGPVCFYPNETAVEAFSAIVRVLNDARTGCEFSSMAEGVSWYTLSLLISDLVVVEMLADDDESALFVDYFHINRTYELKIRSDCDSILCEDFVIYLNVTLLDYTRRLFPYGPTLQDSSLEGVDDGFTTLTALQPVPIFSNHYNNIYVSRVDHVLI